MRSIMTGADKNNDRRSILMIVTSMLIFGTIGIFRRHIPLSSALLAFVRGIVGSFFLLVFMKLKREGAGEKLPGRTTALLVFTGALIGINWMLLFEAYNYTTVPVATLCYYMEPTIVMLLSPLLFGERLTVRKAICAAAAILGMVMVSGVIGGGGIEDGNLRGVLLGLGAAVLYSTVVIMNKRLSGIDAYRKTIIQLLSAGLVMIPYLILTRGFSGVAGSGGFDAATAALVLIVGVVHTGVAYALYFGSIDGLKAQTVALLSYIDPVSALLFAAVFLGEPLSLWGIVGAVMIIGSAIVSEM